MADHMSYADALTALAAGCYYDDLFDSEHHAQDLFDQGYLATMSYPSGEYESYLTAKGRAAVKAAISRAARQRERARRKPALLERGDERG